MLQSKMKNDFGPSNCTLVVGIAREAIWLGVFTLFSQSADTL
jgi:hypothetical protein